MRHRGSRRSAHRIAVSVLLLSGCTTQAGDVDLSNPLQSPTVAVASPLPTAPVRVAWRADLSGEPGLADGEVTAMADAFTVIAADPGEDGASRIAALVLDAATGKVAGRLGVPDALAWPGIAAAGGAAGRLVLAVPVRRANATDGVALHGYDMATGQLAWTRPGTPGGSAVPDAYFKPAPPLDDVRDPGARTLLIGGVTGARPAAQRCAVCALDPSTGQVVWQYAAEEAVTHVAVADDLVTVAQAPVPADGDPQLDRGYLTPTSLQLLRTGTGEPLGRVDLPLRDHPFRNPVVAIVGEAVVAVATLPDGLETVVLDATGRVLWRAPGLEAPVVDPTSATVALLTPDGGYDVHDLPTGDLLWQLSPADTQRDQVVFTQGRAGRLIGTIGRGAIAVEGRTGVTQLVGSFQPARADQWNGRVYADWDLDVADVLVGQASDGRPLGIDDQGVVIAVAD